MSAAKSISGLGGWPLRAVAAPLLVSAAMASPAVWAQSDTAISQAVVQPLPAKEVSDLNTALRRLAGNSRDVGALIDAGNASLAVDDVDAAIGFFGRADELSPNNPRVKEGLAGAFIRRERPIEALQLYAEAEKAGAPTGPLAAERALAYDLVGDNAAAQRLYQQALAISDDAETRRRFALSHAIAGNREAFEKVLYPLLEKRDFAAYRTRAFAMAIMGEDAEAVAIAEAVMPPSMAARIAPYLRYMPRLTKAQQAAAANLGIFPRAAQIGRDSAQIAAYTGAAQAARSADERLAPQGQPLGPQVAAVDASSPRRRPDRGRSAVGLSDVKTGAKEPRGARTSQADDSPTQIGAAQTGSSSLNSPARVARGQGGSAAIALTDDSPLPSRPAVPAAPVAPAAAKTRAAVSPGFDLAAVKTASATSPLERPVVIGTAPAQPDPEAEDSTTVAEAFASLSLKPAPSSVAASGAVDLSKINPPREAAKRAKPEPPKNPRRFWVQVATGKDRNALKFDWRRISRKSGELFKGQSPSVTPWGQSNRLLSGPYDSLKDARKMVNSLKKVKIDSFTFTSPEGQEIEALR